MYIGDFANSRLRMVNTSGIISTIAGNGKVGYSGDGGPATAAQVDQPTSVVFDAAGNLYFTDAGNNVVREIVYVPTGTSQATTVFSHVSVFPNPSNGEFTVKETGVRSQNSQVEIYNIIGEKVYTASLSPAVGGTSITTISLSNGEGRGGAVPGIYIYRIYSKEGGELISTGKLVIE